MYSQLHDKETSINKITWGSIEVLGENTRTIGWLAVRNFSSKRDKLQYILFRVYSSQPRHWARRVHSGLHVKYIIVQAQVGKRAHKLVQGQLFGIVIPQFRQQVRTSLIIRYCNVITVQRSSAANQQNRVMKESCNKLWPSNHNQWHHHLGFQRSHLDGTQLQQT